MLNIIKNQSLKSFNTFNIDVNTQFFLYLEHKDQLLELFSDKIDKFLVIGEGSNILFTKNIDYLIIKNSIKGKKIVFETDKEIIFNISSGENWNDLVWEFSKLNYGGIENLVKIPGNIGAAVVQNIGAYGVEIKDVVESVEVFDTEKKEFKILSKEKLNFSYRDSIFKKQKNLIVTSVNIKLIKNPQNFNINYKGIKENLTNDNLTPYKIADIIANIRENKLPDPKKIGNAGSFFKNPIITTDLFDSLKKKYPEMPFYNSNDLKKIPAAWLIEKANFKGYKIGDVGVYKDHALILVNDFNSLATPLNERGKDIYSLSQKIIDKVYQIFSIKLEREVLVL